MTDPHEDLVEAAAIALIEADGETRDTYNNLLWPKYKAKAAAVIALIAERTKDVTPEMIDACRQMQADQHFGVTTLWTAMHRASALWPKDKP